MYKSQYEVPRYKVAHSRPKRAIILRCFDLRLPDANKGFIHGELDLNGYSYYSMKRAGGAISLARPELDPDSFRSIIGEVKLVLGHCPGITHFVSLGHEDCLRYRELLNGGYKPHIECEDLLMAAARFATLFPQLQFGGYYGRFVGRAQSEISFDTVVETDPSTSLRKILCTA